MSIIGPGKRHYQSIILNYRLYISPILIAYAFRRYAEAFYRYSIATDYANRTIRNVHKITGDMKSGSKMYSIDLKICIVTS